MISQLVKGFILILALVIAVLILLYLNKSPIPLPPSQNPAPSEKVAFEKFKSEEEFKNYLEKASTQTESKINTFGGISTPQMKSESENVTGLASAAQPDRYSQTNVQVAGIDEPDIVKTDGKEIYYSSPQVFYNSDVIKPTEIAPEEPPTLLNQGVTNSKMQIYPPSERFSGGTISLKAFPPESLKIDGKIDKTGDLLLDNGIILVLSPNEIVGYNVKNPANPTKEWQVSLKENVQIMGTRLYKNKVYFTAKTIVNNNRPCLLDSFSTTKGSGSPVSYPIRCTDVYHPAVDSQANSIYTAVKLNSSDGEIEKVISFVGSDQSSTIYMSNNSLYTTYQFSQDLVRFFINFFSENTDLLPVPILGKIKKLSSYDISQTSKLAEITLILGNYQNSLSDSERMKFENNLNNKMASFQKTHKRDMGQTGIVKIDLQSLQISAHSSIPGQPLNQFSLDEFEGNLRIATTVGQGIWNPFISSNTETANDIYILDSNLKTIGSITDLGLTEKIYSARFIEDKGYIVTFRQTDPFYVLDLSNAKSPKMSGELKIPGFSSYLHPITKDLILGVGMESSKVKVSLFDVSDPKNPTEVDKYNLDDYWTEVSNNHHAFLLDKMHKIFFLPGQKGAYVFSYQNNKLNLVKTISDIQTKRAIYIDNYLYILSADKITVLDETTWKQLSELKFE